jgi:predicted dienelactone hydrolase
MRIWTVFVAIMLMFAKASAGTVGFQQVAVPDPEGRPIEVGIWYPSVGQASSQPIGPFRQTVAVKSGVSGNRLPLILISHGTGGSLASHYDTALALAQAGFVVAALTHTGDNYRDQSYAGNHKDLTDRPRQVRLVLEYMLATWPSRDRLDGARIGMFGFSLGGFTTLVEVGGTPTLGRMAQLCSTHPTAPECGFIKAAKGDQLDPIPATSHPVWIHDARIKAAVVAAPAVSLLFGPDDLKQVSIPIQLWRASNDQQVVDEWNTAIIRKQLPETEEHVVPGAGHYVFLAPCSDALAKQAPQICEDASGFDLTEFHQKFNSNIVAFFIKNLAIVAR